MAISAQARATVSASAQQVLEFVLDLDAYQRLDSKILRVSNVVGPDENGIGSLKLWGTLPWMPPAPDKQDFLLESWERLTFSGARRQPARLVFDFTGRFVCEPVDAASTTVTHSYEFRFRGPFKLIEPRIAEWLQTDVEREVADLADVFASRRGDRR